MLELIFNVKKKFFKKMLRQTQAQIWDSEFNRFTAIYEREVLRQQYDQAQDVLHKVEAQGDKEKIAVAKQQVDQLVYSMNQFDEVLNGTPDKVDENGNLIEPGQLGMEQRLQNQMKRKANIEAFIKQYC